MAERDAVEFLCGAGDIGDEKTRRFAGKARGGQFCGEKVETLSGHIENQRCVGGYAGVPVGVLFFGAAMIADENEFRSDRALGESDFRNGGYGGRCGDAGNNLEGYVGFAESANFVLNAAEDQRVAALETNDRVTVTGRVDHALVDFVLRNIFCATALAYVVDGGARGKQIEDLGRDEVVMENDVGAAEDFGGANGEQVFRAGARAHEVDLSRNGEKG